MRMQYSEILDRLSILLHKGEKIGDTECYKEFFAYAKEVLLDSEHINFISDLRKLYKINGEIWNLESDLRKGKEGKFTLEEVGKRAIEIRNKNNMRVSIKNAIAKRHGEFFDIKKDHASE